MKKMYVNKANKLTYRDRLKILKKKILQGWPVVKIAEKHNVTRKTVYKILKTYKLQGLFGLQDKIPGNLRTALNPEFYDMTIKKRKETGWGACRLERYFKDQGFSVSHNKINQIIKYEELTNNRMGKREKSKYVKYEAPENNYQWHIDWSIDPLTKKKLIAIIDDKSRFIVYANLFNSATAENSAIALQSAIDTFGAPKELVSDNGLHFKKSHKEKIPCKPLKEVEEKYGIKHIFIRPYYPQSNGKIERWFGSYKMEFKRMNHPKVHDCLTWVHFYNFERLHQSLDYDTPAQRYLDCNPNSG
jgi:transposase